ncbi:indolepyruvate oxidoreductase subunit beta family protein [Ramlibacter solisilvae]|uniref:Indolepyruvate oxidoreductase n=1 Tax=Ramlibacter tataouinensis TaxID=94132 RepID=A0A127JWI5_9BURK|nr:indolepyruvate oxidoreductase subunit beta family protein [Ramlibacter tataouinensis]AMO22392.1 indolepyruvate oxidoreductase [Ramlibacter tataouinensis]
MTAQAPISLLVCALGGEGGGVLSEWLMDVARAAGYAAQSTSIPGVAQRTGATTYYIEVFPVPLAQLGSRWPVFSLSPVPGALDALVSSELLETVRQVGNGMSSPERTLVISSSSRALTTQERMQMADGRLDSAELLRIVQGFSREHHVYDMAALAKEAGTVVSAVMLGAIAGSSLFPFRREDYEKVVGAGDGAGALASLRGFAAAYERVHAPRQWLRDAGLEATAAPGAQEATDWPAPVRQLATLGVQRMLEYQGPEYAALYTARLRSVLAAERQADPAGRHDFAITREMARWLALWMAFDDIVRVAWLKGRAARWQRVRREVKAGEGDLLRVWDHFKPGVPEFAALLPAALARRLTAWDRARVARGAAPWALPLKVGTHSVFGMLSLRFLAGLKWLRPRGSRYALEQALIERWLGGVLAAAQRDWRLGHEIAQCGRLIKGYGATNERGKDNLLHVLEHLAPRGEPAEAAAAVRAAREAALADDAGKALDAALQQHGAPPRPVKAVPVRWVRRPRGLPAAKES